MTPRTRRKGLEHIVAEAHAAALKRYHDNEKNQTLQSLFNDGTNMPKNNRPKRIDTEAAARWVEKNWKPHYFIDCRVGDLGEHRIKVWSNEKDDGLDIGDLLLDVPFSWLYRKRAPLTGITKRLKKAVRGKK